MPVLLKIHMCTNMPRHYSEWIPSDQIGTHPISVRVGQIEETTWRVYQDEWDKTKEMAEKEKNICAIFKTV